MTAFTCDVATCTLYVPVDTIKVGFTHMNVRLLTWASSTS